MSALNQPVGKHEYSIQLCNSKGCSVSNKIIAYVAPSIAGGSIPTEQVVDTTTEALKQGSKPVAPKIGYVMTSQSTPVASTQPMLSTSTSSSVSTQSTTPVTPQDSSPMSLRRAYSNAGNNASSQSAPAVPTNPQVTSTPTPVVQSPVPSIVQSSVTTPSQTGSAA